MPRGRALLFLLLPGSAAAAPAGRGATLVRGVVGLGGGRPIGHGLAPSQTKHEYYHPTVAKIASRVLIIPHIYYLLE